MRKCKVDEHQKTNDMILVIEINAGDDAGAEIVFEFNGKQINVSLFANPSVLDSNGAQQDTPIEDRLIRLLGRAAIADDDNEYEKIIDEVLEAILRNGKPLFIQVAPGSQASTYTSQHLHSHIYPSRFYFRLQTIDGRPVVSPIRPDEAYSIEQDTEPGPNPDTSIKIRNELPQYSSEDILVLEVLRAGGVLASRVNINGQEMLCKAGGRGLANINLERELVSLSKIWEACSSTGVSVRIPQLRGYIRHTKTGAVIGMLREWIPSGARGRSLTDADVSVVPEATRQGWAAQIRGTLDWLHIIGLVWGDGKLENVIIDKDDQAWLIDLTGDWTRGWVDADVAGTVEGDDQALQNLRKFLGVRALRLGCTRELIIKRRRLYCYY